MSADRRPTATREKGAQAKQEGVRGVLVAENDSVPDRLVSEAVPGVTPARPMVWHLFFPARPLISVELRPKTKTGKPKKHPPRLPPNINERRQMHPMVERKLIEFWRESAVREARRQHAMRFLQRARISAIVYRRNLGVADGSGDSERLKPLVDGLVQAGVLLNDRRREVSYGEVTEQHIGYRGEGVLLIVEALETPPPARGGPEVGGT